MVSIFASLLLQAITTATIRGSVSPDDAHITVVNEATGFAIDAQARRGRFIVQGLEIGGPYVVRVRRIGFKPHDREGVFLSLGQSLELDLRLPPLIAALDTVHVAARERASGTAATVSGALLQRLPSLNRDMYDFVRLAPQISTKVGLSSGGISGGGVNPRFNNYLIDGAPDRFPTGNSATAFAGGKSVPMDAVKEYQVLLAPFDVRFGDFAGALVNTITKAGTNAFHASAFAYRRSDGLARQNEATRNAPYERTQVGFSVSGPLIRDHLHFFVAPEMQRLTSPARGPFLGQALSVSPSVPVTNAEVASFASILRGYGLEAGSGGAATTGSPSTSIFARVDLALPSLSSRAVLIDNYQRTDVVQLSRADTFSLSSYRVTQAFVTHLTSLQVHSQIRGRGYNALTLSFRGVSSENRPDVRQPIVLVSVPSSGDGIATLKAGSQEGAHGVFTRSGSITLTDNLTIAIGASQELVLGGQLELFRLNRGGVNNSYGTWTFSSLDSLAGGAPERFVIRKDFGSVGLHLDAAQYGLYAGHEWRPNERLSLTLGLRADAFALLDRAPYNPEVYALFRRRTDQMPEPRIHVSPRLGFSWDVVGTGRDQIRGGVGVFTGRYPPTWAYTAVFSYGSGIATLQCGGLPADLGPPPPFVANYRDAPSACANGRGIASAPHGDVDLLDRNLRMAQTARASLAYDRRLPWDVMVTAEAMLTRNISDFVFVNLNLKGPQGLDRRGRVMYGTVGPSGVASAALISDFAEVIDLRNVSTNHAVQMDARLEKRFSGAIGALASYTFTRVRDVQLPLRSGASTGIVNWSSGRAVAGYHDDLTSGMSTYDLPHRFVLAGTFQAPWRRWTTDFSICYVGESGSPYTYVAGGVGRRGDLNADGAVGNDPLFIPTSASDTGQIVFSGVSNTPGADNSLRAQEQRVAVQQLAFEQFIARTDCLRRQRGHILRRNSCREPWSNTSIASLRQAVPVARTHGLTLQLDAFNVLNLLNSRWGRFRVAATPAVLLSQVGQTPGAPNVAQPIFRFDASRPRWNTLATESSYQLQLALRYTF